MVGGKPSSPGTEQVVASLRSPGMKNWLSIFVLPLTLSACSFEDKSGVEKERADEVANSNALQLNTAAPIAEVVERPEAPAPNVMTEAGFGGLRIGEPVPAGSTWEELGAQASDTCRTISSRDFVGAYAIVEGGKVRRITAGQRSTAKLAGSIGIGSLEKEVRDQYQDFGAEAHKYQAAPAKYLTAPNASDANPALRFEIDEDSKVGLIHVGTMPTLGYVEACS